MKIESARRLLVVGRPACDLGGLVAKLTGTEPTRDPTGSIAGSTHEWALVTDYYSADIPIWIDEIVDLAEWQAEFSRPEAREVVQALGGIILCFDKAQPPSHGASEELRREVTQGMQAINAIIEKACGYDWEGLKLAVLLSPGTSQAPALQSEREEFEDLCMDRDFEFIDTDASGKNEFGEGQGLNRIKEAVETNEWNAMKIDEEDGNALGSFADEEAQMNDELWGLKASLLAGQDDETADDQVDSLEGLLQQAMAIKEQGADMPIEQRKQFAANAINDLMKNV